MVRRRAGRPGGIPEVCNALGFQETNIRALLHRARAKVRAALESYLKGV